MLGSAFSACARVAFASASPLQWDGKREVGERRDENERREMKWSWKWSTVMADAGRGRNGMYLSLSFSLELYHYPSPISPIFWVAEKSIKFRFKNQMRSFRKFAVLREEIKGKRGGEVKNK
jgi:hypothetical protein